LFGTFGTFALVKCFLLLAGFFGTLTISNIFAAGGEVNSGNIVTEYGCATDATSCNLSYRGITSIAADTFINHTNNFARIDLRGNQLTSFELSTTTSIRDLLLEDNQLTEISLSEIIDLRDLRLYNNQLTEIDLSGLINLNYLYL
jgi:hypothetical protein